VSGLLLILCEGEGGRVRAGLELAATVAAMGRPVRVLLKGAALRSAPRLHEQFAVLHELGAEILACQTDMADGGVAAADLPPGVEAAGMLHAMRGTDGWQLLLA